MNHHRQCITFGATFLANEKDDDSIVWLFEKFIEAMVRKQPSIIITYQDLTVKIVIEKIFFYSSNRFCM